MNAEQEEEFRGRRVRLAELIKREAHLYKVCLVCFSVYRQTAAVCRVCGSYQWDERPQAVIASVEAAALHAFPVTLGYAPSDTRVDKTDVNAYR